MPYYYSYVGKIKLPFGKHKFKTLEKVWSEDPQYCLSFLRYLPHFPKFGHYINEKYYYDLEYFKHKFDVRIRRTSVTVMLKELMHYHKIRIYDCFDGKHVLHHHSVHPPSSYPPYIKENRLFSYNGLFYDLLIRKHIANFFKKENAYDFKVERSFSKFSGDEGFLLLYRQDYEKFKDINNHVIEILPNIFNLALLEKAIEDATLFYANEEMINRKNISNVLSYINRIPDIEHALLNPILDINSFSADADFIINDTIYDVKVSEAKELTIDDFLQLIFYAYAYYVRTGTEIRKYVIYNPLLGEVYRLRINGLNFEKLTNFFQEIIL